MSFRWWGFSIGMLHVCWYDLWERRFFWPIEVSWFR